MIFLAHNHVKIVNYPWVTALFITSFFLNMAMFRMFSLTVHKLFFFNSVEQKRALNNAFCVMGDVPFILMGSCHTAAVFTIN